MHYDAIFNYIITDLLESMTFPYVYPMVSEVKLYLQASTSHF